MATLSIKQSDDHVLLTIVATPEAPPSPMTPPTRKDRIENVVRGIITALMPEATVPKIGFKTVFQMAEERAERRQRKKENKRKKKDKKREM